MMTVSLLHTDVVCLLLVKLTDQSDHISDIVSQTKHCEYSLATFFMADDTFRNQIWNLDCKPRSQLKHKVCFYEFT